jgi:hypothetical protein
MNTSKMYVLNNKLQSNLNTLHCNLIYSVEETFPLLPSLREEKKALVTYLNVTHDVVVRQKEQLSCFTTATVTSFDIDDYLAIIF